MCDQGVSVLTLNATQTKTQTHYNTNTYKDKYKNAQNINFVIRRVDE